MAHQLEVRIAAEVDDVVLRPGEEVVDAQDVVSVRHEPVA